MAVGTITLHQSSTVREANVPTGLDYSLRHEIATGGQLLTGTPTAIVLLTDQPTSDLSVTGIAIDGTGKRVTFFLTDVSAKAGNVYTIEVSVQITNGANPIVESLKARVVKV